MSDDATPTLPRIRVVREFSARFPVERRKLATFSKLISTIPSIFTIRTKTCPFAQKKCHHPDPKRANF